MKTNIIVLSYGQESFTSKCFDSILENTDNYRLVWVDNGSSLESRNTVMKAFLKHENRLPIWTGTNLGFIGGVNLALEMILEALDDEFKFVVLLNNDTEVTNNWLSDMLLAFDDERVAAVGPTTSTSGSWQWWKNEFYNSGIAIPSDLDKTNDKNIISKRLKRIFGHKIKHVPMLAFFCTVFRRSIFEEVGLLDTRF